jgi:hypothetical protein
MRLTLRTVNDEISRRGHTARLEKGSGYFYFHVGEAAEWLDRSVTVRKINDLTLKEWMTEFGRLKALNEQIMKTVKPRRPAGAGTKPEKR